MTASSTLSILIAGGGIGGFAAALALSQKGFPVHVLEQTTEFREVGAGLQLGPNAFKMFDSLDLTDAVDEVAVYPDCLRMMDGLNGDEITEMPLNTPEFRLRFDYPYGVIYRPDLHKILIDAASKNSIVQTRNETKIKNFFQADGRVVVTTENGEEIEGRALIGCDGLWSDIRRQLLNDGNPRVSGHIAYRAVLPTAEVPALNNRESVILWAGPRTHLVHYPLHRGEIFNLVAVFHSDRYEEGWDVYGDIGELSAKFSGQHQGVLGMLEKIESWRMWVLCDREPMRNWTEDRVTLLGDAAHPMLQYLAQGAAMAIEDAVCLAHHLEKTPEDPAQAFKAYQANRYLRTTRVQLMARVYGDVYHARDATADLRNLMLKNRDPAAAYEGMRWLYAGIDEHGNQAEA